MSKYICLCGLTLDRKKQCIQHLEIYKDLNGKEGFPQHRIFKQNWKGQLLDFLIDIPWQKMFRILGIYIVSMTIMHHFGIEIDFCEAILMGLGLGLIV